MQGTRGVFPPGVTRRVAFAFCVLHLALAVACAKAPPRTAPAPVPAVVAPRVSPLAQLRDDIAAATSAPGVQRATWGIIVQSLDRHERLFELNPRTLLVPASISKLLSAATAADAVGWDYRYTTTVAISGSIADGVLHGDLIVESNGDPSIGGRAGDDMRVFVDAIRSAGITRIEGRVIGDDDLLEDARPAFAWSWDDIGYPSGALFGALNYGENRSSLTVEPGAAPGAQTTVTGEAVTQGRPIVNRATTVAPGGPALLWPEQRPGEAALTVAGTIPVGASAARVNVSAGNPTQWFVNVLRNQLIAAGIPVSGGAFDIDDLHESPAGSVIVTYRSRTLGEIAQPMLKESINLYAEAAMRLNAAAMSPPKTHDAALEAFRMRMNAWGISSDAFQIVDGSGLSRRNAVAAETIVAVLQRMYDPGGQSPWMQALPIAGVDGSLRGRMTGTAAVDNVRAKTGSMSNIRSLAGYVTTADGEHLALVIIVNDFEGSGAAAVAAIDSIAVRLAQFTRLN